MCVRVYLYMYVCIHLCRRQSETLPRCTPARKGAPLGRRRVCPTLTLVHTHTHTGTGLARLSGRGMRPKGSRLFLTDGARHPRAPAPGWAPGGFVALFLLLLFFFSVFCLVFFFFLPVFGWRSVASTLRSRRRAPAAPTARGAGAGAARSPRGLRSAEPPPCRALPAPRGLTPRLFPRREVTLSPPPSRCHPPVGLKPVRSPPAGCQRRAAPPAVPGTGRWRPCGVAGRGSGR